jgi:N4-gp56 family major capsid protein
MALTVQASTDFAQKAYELMAFYALRPELYFDAVADVRPTNQSQPGSSVQFTITADLVEAITPLSETVDVTPQVLSDSTVLVTLLEYGNAVTTTALARGTSFVDLDPVVANIVGFNAGKTVDTLARNVLTAGTNVAYAVGDGSNVATSRITVGVKNTLVAADVRSARAALVRNNVPNIGGYYMGFIHPDSAFDLRGQTGTATWNEPHAYSAPDQIWSGEIGSFSGVRFIETPRGQIFADAGGSPPGTASNVDVYATLFMGRQALAKAYSYVDGNGERPLVVPGPVTDALRRFVPIGWYQLVGYGLFRQLSVLRIEGASTLGLNTVAGSH